MLLPPNPKPNPLPHPQQERRISSQMISQQPFPSFPHPFPLPQQQSNKRGNRQFPKPKPPSHPFPLFWQFVAAKSLILWSAQVSLTQSAVMLGLRVRGRGGRDRIAPVAAPISAFLWGSTPFLCARAKKWGGIGSRGHNTLPNKTAHT